MPVSHRQPSSPQNAWIAAGLFLAGFALATGHLAQVQFGGGFETLAIARNLAWYGRFANPYYVLPTGLSAHCAPLYPALMALVFWALGNITGTGAIIFFSMAMHGANAALMPSVSGLFFGDRRPGIWAGAMAALLPLYYVLPQFDMIYFSAGAMLFCLAAHRLSRGAERWRGLAIGIFAGLLALLNPASVCVTAPWLAYLAWRRRIRLHSIFALAIVLGGILTLAPWTWRNYRVFHALFFVRDDLGLELYVSNNDRAAATEYANFKSGAFNRLHPNVSLPEALAVRELGEVRYNSGRLAAARRWIAAHPRRYLALTAARARQFWFPWEAGKHGHDCSVAAVTAISFLGLLLLALRRQPACVYLAAVLLIYPLLYYSIQMDPRYRAAILWVSLLACGYALAAGAERIARLRAIVSASPARLPGREPL